VVSTRFTFSKIDDLRQRCLLLLADGKSVVASGTVSSTFSEYLSRCHLNVSWVGTKVCYE
jgi:hypothetical protein